MNHEEPAPDSLYPLYSRADAAKKLLMSKTTLAKLTKQGMIVPIRTGVSVCYSHAALSRFVRQAEEAAQDKANA